MFACLSKTRKRQFQSPIGTQKTWLQPAKEQEKTELFQSPIGTQKTATEVIWFNFEPEFQSPIGTQKTWIDKEIQMQKEKGFNPL